MCVLSLSFFSAFCISLFPPFNNKTCTFIHIELSHLSPFSHTHTLSHQTQTFSYSGVFKNLGHDNSFKFSQFRRDFGIEIVSLNEEELVFDMWGIEAPIANAIRRILISEVPTVAIEKVVIANNTSIIQDEVLAHRLGLVPIKVDPRLFDFKQREWFWGEGKNQMDGWMECFS